METKTLTEDTITFGKYQGCSVGTVLRDRKYCQWLLEQEWFRNNYEYLHNRVSEFDPKPHFLRDIPPSEDAPFVEKYKYFNLKGVEDVTMSLTDKDKKCYEFYLKMLEELKGKVVDRMESFAANPYDIKAPVKWLQRFEKEYEISRDDFKEFLAAHELPNLPYIIEAIKKEGGIEYKGANSFNIAKERSLAQEKWWEDILKERYGEDVGTQFKYENCIFDFINIGTNTIFECKLALKDFNKEQHRKYILTLDKFRIIYLIDYDAVIDIEKKTIYSSDNCKYRTYKCQIPLMKKPSEFDLLIQEFAVVEVEDLKTLFN